MKIHMVNKEKDGGLSFYIPSRVKRRQIISLMHTLDYRLCTAEELEAALRRGRTEEASEGHD